MTTGWQRQFKGAARQARRAGDQHRLKKDIASGNITGQSLSHLYAEYHLPQREIKRIIQEAQHKDGES